MDAVTGLPGLAAIWQVAGARSGEGNEAAVRALLAAFVGKELEGLLEMLTPTGAKVRFPGGVVVAAEGEVAFPQGTVVRLQVQPRNGGQGYELRMLEAHPPAPAPLLRPLVQGEASALMARVTQPDPPKELGLLRQVLELLGRISSPPEQTEPAAGPGRTWTPRQTAELPLALQEEMASVLQVELEELPRFLESLRQTFSRAERPAPGPTPASSSIPFMGALPAEDLGEPTVSMERLPGRSTAGASEGKQTSDLERVATLQARLEPRLDLPGGLRSLLEQLVLAFKVMPKSSRPPVPAEGRAGPTESVPNPPNTEARIPARGAPPRLDEEPRMTSQTKLEHMARRPAEERVTPPRLETWLRESLRVLGDPQLSPREAPFHQLQAVEKTAYFELPAPLAGAEAMQLWVEWDEAPPDGERGQGEPPLRLLLGTRFSALGETRIGFLAAQEHLALRIWTEHPEHLEGELPALEAELRTCFHRVDLKVVPMGSESPSVRELIMTPGWSALA